MNVPSNNSHLKQKVENEPSGSCNRPILALANLKFSVNELFSKLTQS